MFTADNQNLLYNGKTIHTLPGIITEIFNENGLAILMYKLPNPMAQFDTETVIQNVRAYDQSGKEVWMIEYVGDRKGRDCFSSLRIQDGQYRAYRTDGFDMQFDPKSGKIIQSSFIK